MYKPENSLKERENLLILKVDEIRREISLQDPSTIAKNCGANFYSADGDNGIFNINYWKELIEVNYPDYFAYKPSTKEKLGTIHQAVLMYYFMTSDGAPVSQKWISFADLSGGKFYNQAFQSYTGQVLLKLYNNNLSNFAHSASLIGGEPYSFADTCFIFSILPRVSILIACWQGDEELRSSFQLLFDSSANHYLPTDAYAIIGSMLTHKLVSQAAK